MNGFRQYSGLNDVSYCPVSPCTSVETEVRDKNQDILDLIFSVDPVTLLPVGSLAMYMSDKTNKEVVEFIEQNLLREFKANENLNLPQAVRDGLRTLDSKFMAEISRNRFESVEDYELRVRNYLDNLKHENDMKSLREKIVKKFTKHDNE